MERREYRDIVAKGLWGDGPWLTEPDKVQWQDAETGLPCLIVRGPVGSLCGYVGVLPGHLLHGKSYSECVWPEDHREGEGDGYHYSCTPESALSAHGGITHAAGCADLSRERWIESAQAVPEFEKTAAVYPRGDAARWLQEWEPLLKNYDAWRERMEARSICHIPGPGEPDSVWWFGFDCAHAGDYCPKFAETMASLRKCAGIDGVPGFPEDTYKTIAYVEAQVVSLAEQLKALAEPRSRRDTIEARFSGLDLF